MPNAHYRPLHEAEIPAAADLFITSVTDLAARRGFPPPAFTRASIEPVYRHIFRTGIFEAAEVGGELAAIGHAIVRDRLWFLSGFWARPDLQGQRIGGPLLARVWELGRARGAEVAFTWSSIDTTAMAAYMKMGMLPGYPILQFVGTLSNALEFDPGYAEAPLDPAFAAALDREVRATGRAEDHAFWRDGGGTLRAVTFDGQPVGYYHASRGAVGPAAWSRPEHGEAVVRMALREAARQGGEVRLMVPGVNHMAIRLALGAGLRLASFSHLLTTEAFGALERYLPSGPSLF